MESVQVMHHFRGLTRQDREDMVGQLAVLRMANAPGDVAEGYSKFLLGDITKRDFDIICEASARESGQ